MAHADKNILITPNISSSTDDPNIVFSGADASTAAQDISVFAYPANSGTLSFEGSSGQLFSITNDLTGSIFSVNDISGIPSLEVNADGTVSIAEFDGEVGIGTSAPTEMLHVEGRDVASSSAGILVQARGDAFVSLIADTVSDAETNNPYILFSQDGAAVQSVVGSAGAADIDAQGNAFTGMTNNGFAIHHRFGTGTVEIGVNGAVGLRVDDSNVVTAIGGFSGVGTSLTALTAANISAGNLGSSVFLNFTAASASTSYKVPFMNYTGTSTTNVAMLHDSTANFTYNPATNTLAVGALTGTAVTTTGDVTADNFEATGLGPNTTPGTDDAYIGGYGVLTSRATSYFSNVAGAVALNHTGLHGTNTKLTTTSAGINVTGDVVADGLNNYLEANDGAGDHIRISHDGTTAIIGTAGTGGGAVDITFESTGTEDFRIRESVTTGETSHASVRSHDGTLRDVGFNILNKEADNPASVALSAEECGAVIFADDNTGFTVTVEASGTLDFPIGGMTTIINGNTSVAITIADNSTIVYYLDGSTRTDIGATGTVAAGGVCNIWREAAGVYYIWGTGITV